MMSRQRIPMKLAAAWETDEAPSSGAGVAAPISLFGSTGRLEEAATLSGEELAMPEHQFAGAFIVEGLSTAAHDDKLSFLLLMTKIR